MPIPASGSHSTVIHLTSIERHTEGITSGLRVTCSQSIRKDYAMFSFRFLSGADCGKRFIHWLIMNWETETNEMGAAQESENLPERPAFSDRWPLASLRG